jgi:SAM-dependent methyltransferase
MTLLRAPNSHLPASCPICSSPGGQNVFDLRGMPVFVGVQWPSVDAARRCARGDLDLTFCPCCGFIWNQAFNATKLEYSEQYDNVLDYSKVFQQYAQNLVSRLVRTYDIRNKRVVEIGCGKGRFLAMLCEWGNNSGIGFDPSYDGERWPSPAADRITYIRDLYSEKYACQSDLVCCRFVFEHIPQPLNFLELVRRAIGDRTDTIIYFEVPNARLTVDESEPWDVIYEHCSYFSVESLAHVFQMAGFEILQLGETYDGQFLGIDARPASNARPVNKKTWGDLQALRRSVDRFRNGIGTILANWQERLDEWLQGGRKVAAWGAGARAVSFLNVLKSARAVPYVVDINPHKQGLHLAGTGQKIVAPEFLRDYQPDVVVLMNPIYRTEIADQINSFGLSPELVDAF